GIISYEQVQVAVAVVINPRGTRRPLAGISDSGLVCYIRESSIPVVVKQSGRGAAGDEQIREAVIVKIGDCDTHSIKRDMIDAGAASPIDEFAVAEVAV